MEVVGHGGGGAREGDLWTGGGKWGWQFRHQGHQESEAMGSEPSFHHFPALWLWTNDSPFLSLFLHALIHFLGIASVPGLGHPIGA